MTAPINWLSPEYAGPACRWCGKLRATEKAEWLADGLSNAEWHDSKGYVTLCWGDAGCTERPGTPDAAYDRAIADVVAWLRKSATETAPRFDTHNEPAVLSWSADAIECGEARGAAKRKDGV